MFQVSIPDSNRSRAASMVCSWCASTKLPIDGIHRSLFWLFSSSFWNRITFESQSFHGRLYCTRRALWKLEWFLRDFGYDAELLDRDQVDEKALLGLRGVVRTSHTTVNGRILSESRFICAG